VEGRTARVRAARDTSAVRQPQCQHGADTHRDRKRRLFRVNRRSAAGRAPRGRRNHQQPGCRFRSVDFETVYWWAICGTFRSIDPGLYVL